MHTTVTTTSYRASQTTAPRDAPRLGSSDYPALDEAIDHLAAAQDALVTMWASESDLGTDRASMLCSAHRSVHEALLLLEHREQVLFPTSSPDGASTTVRGAAAR